MPIRTFLFAPANHARRVEKAFTLGADAVILDLEDAVAVAEKPAARSKAIEALQSPRGSLGYVRVNAMDTPYCWGDLQAVVAPGLDGIVLPKVETAAGLVAADWLVSQLERERGLPAGRIDILPILETARAVTDIDAIMRAGSRVRRVAFGAGDYSLDLGVTWSRDEIECRHARDVIVTASRAHGLEAPLDSAYARLDDEEGLLASARAAAAIGYQGKMCIHPRQVAPVNAVFSPSAEEIAFARRVVDAFAEAERGGSSAFQLDGKFIDYPILFRARRVLALAEPTTHGERRERQERQPCEQSK
jgi:citrate lyase subunit beta/citryl-CoA lyase